MNFAQFLLILQARKKIVLGTLIATVAITVLVSLLLPATYKGASTVLLNTKGVDPVTGMTMPGQLMPSYVATQIDLISSKNVALRVVDQLKLASNPAVQQQFREDTGGKGTVRDWLADLLLKKLDVVPSRESSVIEINFKGSDPAFVAAVANAFADEYQKLSVQLKSDPMKKATGYFTEQIKGLRDQLEAAQSRLSKYQQENGIVSVDNRLDVESNRLNDLSAQLVVAQAQQMEASSRRSVASGRALDSPDVAASPLVQNLRAQLSLADTKLAEVGQRLGRNHPQYQSAKAEADQLRASLNSAVSSTSNSVGNNAQILGARESQLRQALAEQKTKILEINRSRDELNVLQRDVEAAQRAMDAASLRLSQTRMEGQSDQSDIALLNPAVPPVEPSSPRLLLNTALALFMGTLLGVGFGMLAEMLDRRVRSRTDLADLVQIPVLGEIHWGPARARSKLGMALMPRRVRLT
ncbi:chain-length determining protein [Massilia sp. Root351]|uniref:chain length determinant protein EpsF n=1 Tax=Massilia sp. Root351 TaxID=1736522 RepID=UPI00070E9A83|nr:chain length determinant protein EpsF [Massilia sp. Root351]KQV78456.1 chain-length determining protein [Massilia sp. Root351]